MSCNCGTDLYLIFLINYPRFSLIIIKTNNIDNSILIFIIIIYLFVIRESLSIHEDITFYINLNVSKIPVILNI